MSAKRRVEDPRSIRALAHPARLAMINALASGEELTATQCAELTGLSPSATAYHLKLLERHGYAEAASPRPDRRERPWRAAGTGSEVYLDDSTPAGASAAAAVGAAYMDATLELAVEFTEGGHDEPAEWRDAVLHNVDLWLTVEEFRRVAEELGAGARAVPRACAAGEATGCKPASQSDERRLAHTRARVQDGLESRNLAGVEVTFTEADRASVSDVRGAGARTRVGAASGARLRRVSAPRGGPHARRIGGRAGRWRFGRLAAGQNNIPSTADPAAGPRQRRRERKRRATVQERDDMARSELLASACPPLWELRTGRRTEPPEWFSRLEPEVAASPLVDRIIERLHNFAARWHELPPGDGITLEWSLGAEPRRTHHQAGAR